ncbi:MAG: sulfite exporter TauE/SafE family protein [Actinobacteria bacterium]|nr:sulfite exporter TauE/SafE family protein [Actinomycetota bacterium]
MAIAESLFTVLLGFASGFASGAFGIGGGAISTPAIRLLLMQSSDIALGTPLPVVIPSAVVGGFNYWRAGKIIPRVVGYCAVFGLLGTALGSLLTSLFDTRYIMIITSLLILYLAERTFASALGRDPYAGGDRRGERCHRPAWMLSLIGFCAGFFSGFLGLGGGIILVPAFFFLLRLEVKECLGNSLAVIAILAVPGSIIHSFLGHVDWTIALAMALGVMPGSYVGSFFTLRARDRRVLALFAVFLAAVGIIFLLKEVSGLA